MSIDLKKAQQLKTQLDEYLNKNSRNPEIVKKNLTKKQLEKVQELLIKEGANTDSRGSEEINWAVREIQGGSGMGSGCVLSLIEQILSGKTPYNFEDYPQCKKCGGISYPLSSEEILNQKTKERIGEGWCALCVNNEHFRLCHKDGNGIWFLIQKEITEESNNKEEIKKILEKIMNAYNDNLKKSFNHPNWQPQSPLLLSKVDKKTAQELLPLIEALPNHNKKVDWLGFNEHFPFGIYVLSREVKEEEVKDIATVKGLYENSEKYLDTLLRVINELKEIIGKEDEEENDPLTGNCSVCNNKAYTELTLGKQVSGKKNGVWYCRNHFPKDEGNDNNREREREREREQNTKKYGVDYSELKGPQKLGRNKTYDNWEEKRKNNYGRYKVCRYCPQTFQYDNLLEFLSAKTKAEQELKNHEANCSKKNDQKEQQRLKQEKWEKRRKQNGSPFHVCRKCWGKVCLDKKIENWVQANKQALADLAYHEKKECGTSLDKKKIPICFSPNKGGNEHADISFADEINENELELEQDNETEVIYQEQENITNNNNKTKILPYILGGIGIIAVLGIVIALIRKRKNKIRKTF